MNLSAACRRRVLWNLTLTHLEIVVWSCLSNLKSFIWAHLAVYITWLIYLWGVVGYNLRLIHCIVLLICGLFNLNTWFLKVEWFVNRTHRSEFLIVKTAYRFRRHQMTIPIHIKPIQIDITHPFLPLKSFQSAFKSGIGSLHLRSLFYHNFV